MLEGKDLTLIRSAIRSWSRRFKVSFELSPATVYRPRASCLPEEKRIGFSTLLRWNSFSRYTTETTSLGGFALINARYGANQYNVVGIVTPLSTTGQIEENLGMKGGMDFSDLRSTIDAHIQALLGVSNCVH